MFPALRSAAFSLQMSNSCRLKQIKSAKMLQCKYTKCFFPADLNTQMAAQACLKNATQQLYVKISITAVEISHSFTYFLTPTRLAFF